MRVSEAGLALIRRTGPGGTPEYLTQWNDKWQRFSLIGGHREPGESFRACCAREVTEELELTAGTDFRVAPEPVVPVCEYRALSGSAGVETQYRVALFEVELLTPEAIAKVDADPGNRWVREPEVRRHFTFTDRRAVAAQVETVLTLTGVLPVREEYDLFVSYAHADDADGFVTALVAALQEEHQRFSREPLRVFFDLSAIRTAQDWEERLLHGLKSAKALLTVLSPAYFASPWCRREWETFVEHEKGRAWPGEPLTPVYAADVPGFDGPEAESRKEWLAGLLRAQYCDLKQWRPHGERAFRELEVRRRMEAVHQWLSERLQRVEVTGRSASHGVPRHNRNFVGREADMRRVRERLVFGQVAAVTAVSGIGGIGKTALAAEYAHLFADEYPGGRFWLPAERANDFCALLCRLEPELGLTFSESERRSPELAYARIRGELERRAGALIVLDNVSDFALLDPVCLSRHRPDGHKVHILATAREEPPPDPEGLLASVPLDRLAPDDGRQLLNRYRPLGTDEGEWHAAREIVSALGGHALSLEVVGVYLWQHREVSYRDYRAWMQEEGVLAAMEGAGEGVRLSRHAEPLVSKLLKPTLDALSPAELRALEYAALLPADWVALPWLKELVGADIPEAVTRAKPWKPDPWAGVVGRLRSLRLLAPGDDPRLAKMHRVVQAVVLGRTPVAEQERRREKLEALSIARGRFLKTEWYKADARWEMEPLHLFCVHQLGHNRWHGATLAGWIGEPLRLLGLFSEGRRLLQRAVEVGDKHSHPVLSVLCSNLASVERDLGDLASARRLYCRALEMDERRFDPDDPRLATHHSNLGLLELELGNLTAARLRLQRAIELQVAHVGADHPTLTVSYSNLGLIERDLGNVVEARRLLRLVIEIEEKHFDPDHPTLAVSYSNLGNVERNLGNLAEARQLFRRAIAIDERCFGPDHPNRAVHCSNLGNVESDLGNPGEARRLFRRAIEIGERHFGLDHPNLATRYWNLAMLEQQEGNGSEAVALVRRAHASWRGKLGPDHPNTKMARDWLSENDPDFDPNA